MTTYPNTLWYHVQDGLETLAHEPMVGAVPYMLARPQTIKTAPRDGVSILGWVPAGRRHEGWGVMSWNDAQEMWCLDDELGAWVGPSHWLPLPPAPEEA